MIFTALGGMISSLFRAMLMPIDTCKTGMIMIMCVLCQLMHVASICPVGIISHRQSYYSCYVHVTYVLAQYCKWMEQMAIKD